MGQGPMTKKATGAKRKAKPRQLDSSAESASDDEHHKTAIEIVKKNFNKEKS